MTIGLLSAALYMGLQMFVKPYRSYRSQMLADGLMLMLLLFLLLGTHVPCLGLAPSHAHGTTNASHYVGLARILRRVCGCGQV